MVTIKDVAKKAGVSISTASYALNDDPRISNDTKERILKVARKLNYYPNAAARNLKRKKTNIIGVFVDGFGGPVHNKILEGVHYELMNNNYNIIVSSGDSGKKLLLERQVDGAIIFDRSLEDDLITHVAENGIPTILLDRKITGKNIFVSMMRNEEIAYELVTKMINKGYKKIGYVSGLMNSFDNLHRFKGFVKALTEHDLPTNFYYKGDFTKDSGYKVGKELLVQENKPDFIFCANDEMAIGVLDALHEGNIKVPEEIAIAGFDNIDLSEYCTPKLTTVNVDRFKWGREITKALLEVLINEHDTVEVQVNTNIIYRESC